MDEWLDDIGAEDVMPTIDAAIAKEDRWSFSYIRDITGGVSFPSMQLQLIPDSRCDFGLSAAEPSTNTESVRTLCPDMDRAGSSRDAVDAEMPCSCAAHQDSAGTSARLPAERQLARLRPRTCGPRRAPDDVVVGREGGRGALRARRRMAGALGRGVAQHRFGDGPCELSSCEAELTWQLYTAIPASKVSVPKNQFMLRHKLALRGALLKPSWEDWAAARKALDRVTVSSLRPIIS